MDFISTYESDSEKSQSSDNIKTTYSCKDYGIYPYIQSSKLIYDQYSSFNPPQSNDNLIKPNGYIARRSDSPFNFNNVEKKHPQDKNMLNEHLSIMAKTILTDKNSKPTTSSHDWINTEYSKLNKIESFISMSASQIRKSESIKTLKGLQGSKLEFSQLTFSEIESFAEREIILQRKEFTSSKLHISELSSEALLNASSPNEMVYNTAETIYGPNYLRKIRLKAGPDPGKIAKRKHQIKTVYYQAQLMDMELYNRHTRSVAAKANAAVKYGW